VKLLVVGSGGREHALAWKIAQSPRVAAVLAAPGSDAMSAVATCFPAVKAGDVDAVLALAKAQRADLVVVGPEDPLAAGIADRLTDAGFAVFGPSAAAARLEGSKSFAKAFMQRHGIPTAGYRSFESLASALAFVRERNLPCVVKADGLASGKGVTVARSLDEALDAIDDALVDNRFGAAGA